MLELIKMVGWNSNQMEWKELPYMNDIIEQWHQFVNKLASTKSLEKKCEKGAEKNFQRRIRIQLWGTFYLWLVLHTNRQLFLATYQRKVRIFSGAALQGILHGDQQQVSSWITSMWWHLRKKERERVVKERRSWILKGSVYHCLQLMRRGHLCISGAFFIRFPFRRYWAVFQLQHCSWCLSNVYKYIRLTSWECGSTLNLMTLFGCSSINQKLITCFQSFSSVMLITSFCFIYTLFFLPFIVCNELWRCCSNISFAGATRKKLKAQKNWTDVVVIWLECSIGYMKLTVMSRELKRQCQMVLLHSASALILFAVIIHSNSIHLIIWWSLPSSCTVMLQIFPFSYLSTF